MLEDRNIQFKCYEFRHLIKNHQNLPEELGLGSGRQKQRLASMVPVGKEAGAGGNSSLEGDREADACHSLGNKASVCSTDAGKLSASTAGCWKQCCGVCKQHCRDLGAGTVLAGLKPT